MNIIAMHHNSKYFAEPYTYRPERFLAGSSELAARPDNAFLPFGIGHGVCPGKAVAWQLILQVLARTLKEVKIEMDVSR